jgi:hypothetical protein
MILRRRRTAGQLGLDSCRNEIRGGYPSGPALRTSLSMSSPSISTFTPSLRPPRRFSRGTNTLSKVNSPVLEPRMPSLSSFRVHEKPVEFV